MLTTRDALTVVEDSPFDAQALVGVFGILDLVRPADVVRVVDATQQGERHTDAERNADSERCRG